MSDLEPPFLPRTKKTQNDPKKIGPWKVGRTLGAGASGKSQLRAMHFCLTTNPGRVRIARHATTGQLAAIKIVPCADTHGTDSLSDAPDEAERKALELNREIAVMKCINHPNIMALYDVWETSSNIYLILEYVQGGELFDYICSKGKLPVDEARDYFQQIIHGIDYCHRFNIAHRDLKPENILLDQDANIKIADFGMAAHQQQDRHMETACGSPHYAAPEVVNCETYDGPTADIWSCGVILYALLAARLPFDDDNIENLLEKVRQGNYEMPDDIDSLAKDLISKMLQKDVIGRIKMEGIQAHPFYLAKPPRNPNIDLPDLDNIVLPVSEVDPLIMPSLRALFLGSSDLELEVALTNGEKNWEKGLYHMMADYRQRVLKNHVTLEGTRTKRTTRPKLQQRSTASDGAHQSSGSLPPRARPPTPRRAATHTGGLPTISSSTSLDQYTERIPLPQPASPISSAIQNLQLQPLEVPESGGETFREFLSQVAFQINALQAKVGSPAFSLDSPSPLLSPLIATNATRPLNIPRKLHEPTAIAAKSNVAEENIPDDEFHLVDSSEVQSEVPMPKKILIQEPVVKRPRSKLRRRHTTESSSQRTSDAGSYSSSVSPWSLKSAKRGWLSNLFRMRSTSYVLLSTHNVQTTRAECRRLLMEMDVRVALENAETFGILRCRVDESSDKDISVTPRRMKSVKFRVEVHPYLGLEGHISVYLAFMQEKGSTESLRWIFEEFAECWTLDKPGSVTPKAVAAELPRLHLRSITN